MGAPVNIRQTGITTDQNRVSLAVAENDGNIQELIEFNARPIQDGSTLKVYSANWSTIRALYHWVGVWSENVEEVQSTLVLDGSEISDTNPMNVVGDSGYPTASITRPNDIVPYSIGDVVGQSPAAVMIFSNVLSIVGGKFIILGVKMRVDVATIPSGLSSFRLHLYSSTPTAIVDNAAFNLPAADRGKYIGFVPITLEGSEDLGDTIFVQNDNLNVTGKLAEGSTTLYAQLETRTGWTPTANVVKNIWLSIAGY